MHRQSFRVVSLTASSLVAFFKKRICHSRALALETILYL
jgi:hypothetical protein